MNFDTIKEQWEDLSEWQKILAVGLITLLIIYGIYALYIDPKQLEEKRLKQEVKNLQIQLDRLKRFAIPDIGKKLKDKLTSIQAEIGSLKKQLKEIKSIVPSEEKTQKILRYISSSAYKTNITLKKFKVFRPEEIYMGYNRSKDKLEIIADKKKRKDKSFIKINRIKINLDMESRAVSDIISFLRELAKSDRFFKLDSLTIKKKKSKKRIDTFDIKMVISTFFM